MNVNSKKKYLDLQSFLLMQEKFWKQKSCDDSIKLGIEILYIFLTWLTGKGEALLLVL